MAPKSVWECMWGASYAPFLKTLKRHTNLFMVSG